VGEGIFTGSKIALLDRLSSKDAVGTAALLRRADSLSILSIVKSIRILLRNLDDFKRPLRLDDRLNSTSGTTGVESSSLGMLPTTNTHCICLALALVCMITGTVMGNNSRKVIGMLQVDVSKDKGKVVGTYTTDTLDASFIPINIT
jgi:hypothetical protein